FNGSKRQSQILPLQPSRFTKHFNRLVNFLNIRMSIEKFLLGNAFARVGSIPARRGSRMVRR
ncbi:MAG: hypothetical protein WA645_07045, partial [Pseudolabrys sp.]